MNLGGGRSDGLEGGFSMIQHASSGTDRRVTKSLMLHSTCKS
jgi:hypothetical protein